MSGRAWLTRVDPVAKVAGPAPAMVFLALARDPWAPLAFLVVTAVLLVTGSGVRWSRLLAVVGGIVAAMPVLVLFFALFADPRLTAGTSVLARLGPVTLTLGGLHAGGSTALRLGALLLLVLVGGLTTTGPALVRALVAHLRVPYRLGYAALASYRFVPRYRAELAVIHAAQRVRGVPAPRGPLGRARRAGRAAVPLLAGGVRHAERVAMAMDARAFGAHPHRTERSPVAWRTRDTAFVLACWLVSAAIVVALAQAGLLARLSLNG